LQIAPKCAIDKGVIRGDEFERRIRSVGRRRRVVVLFDSSQGNGSHGRLYYGERFATLKDRKKEIGPGPLKAMLDQLGLKRDDIEE